jgi:BirA family biotin operon repressor/biotin-[acetyl-CoA-carboxylase] ligase
MKKLFEYLKQFESQGLESFMELWQQHDYLYHKNIKLLLGDKPISGKAMGINSQGLLKLELNNGELKSFASGEVSIKLSE